MPNGSTRKKRGGSSRREQGWFDGLLSSARQKIDEAVDAGGELYDDYAPDFVKDIFEDEEPAPQPKPRREGALSSSRTKRNPSFSERVEKAGGLGMTDETRSWLGGGPGRGPLRAANNTLLDLVDIPVMGLEAMGHGAEWLAVEADNAARESGIADALSWDGNKFLPGTAAMAMGEAFPMGTPHGSSVTIGNAATRGSQAARRAAQRGGQAVYDATKDPLSDAYEVVRDVLEDETGSTPMPGQSLPPTERQRLRLTHTSPNRDLTEVDPSMIGSNNTNGQRLTNREEVSKAQTATGGRAYFGVRTDQPGGYREEQPGAQRYETYVDPDRFLHTDGDSVNGPVEYDRFLERADALLENPKALEAMGLPSAPARSVVTERLIKNSGYDGILYGPEWNQKYGSRMGEVAHYWGDPLPVSKVQKGLEADAFGEADLDRVMSQDNWAIMTGENPMGKALSADENLKLNDELLQAARDMGIEPVPVQGHYGGNPENSFMLSPITQEQAVQLGQRFNQDSVLTNRGLLYHDGTITPATGAKRFDEAPDDFYSTIETSNGPAPFAVDLEWDDAGDMVRIADETRQAAPEAPAILKHPLKRQPDYGYQVQSSKLRNQPEYDDIGVDFEQTAPMADRQVINPEQLVGGNLIAGMSDLTRAGGVLKGIEGRAFNRPVNMQGGQDFMRTQSAGDTGALWASDKGPMTGVLRTAREQDGPSYYAPFTMNAGGSDYSHMMTDAILETLPQATKKARGEFDRAFKGLHPDFLGTKGLVEGGDVAALREQLMGRAGMRTDLAKELDKARWRDAGLPNIGVLRQAINDPNLARAPTESFGYSLGRIDPNGELDLEGAMPHETYRAQLPGDYLGGLESQVPANIMFPDFFDDAMTQQPGKKPPRREDVGYRLKRGVKTQKMDQEWLDGIMPYLEWARSEGDLNW